MKKRTVFAILLCVCLTSSVAFAGCKNNSEDGIMPDTSVSQGSEAQGSKENNDTGSDTSEVSANEVSANEEASANEASSSETNEPATIDNIRNLVVGIDEPIELKDGTKRPLINFDNAVPPDHWPPVIPPRSASQRRGPPSGYPQVPD